jgi:hypothetical protein
MENEGMLKTVRVILEPVPKHEKRFDRLWPSAIAVFQAKARSKRGFCLTKRHFLKVAGQTKFALSKLEVLEQSPFIFAGQV